MNRIYGSALITGWAKYSGAGRWMLKATWQWLLHRAVQRHCNTALTDGYKHEMVWPMTIIQHDSSYYRTLFRPFCLQQSLNLKQFPLTAVEKACDGMRDGGFKGGLNTSTVKSWCLCHWPSAVLCSPSGPHFTHWSNFHCQHWMWFCLKLNV